MFVCVFVCVVVFEVVVCLRVFVCVAFLYVFGFLSWFSCFAYQFYANRCVLFNGCVHVFVCILPLFALFEFSVIRL